MPLDNFINQARDLKSEGRSDSEISEILKQYGATANQADSALKELQKEARKKFKLGGS
jgi:hypothetical protein